MATMASHRTGDLCNRDLNVFTRAMYYVTMVLGATELFCGEGGGGRR